MIIPGAAFANDDSNSVADVDVAVIDDNCDPVENADIGDTVTTSVNATTCGFVKDPITKITLDPECGIIYDPACATMWDGQCWITNDLCDPFFYEDCGSWIWDMGWMTCPGVEYKLLAPGTVCANGPINVTTDFSGKTWNWWCWSDETLLDSDSYSFNGVANSDSSVDLEMVDPVTGEVVDTAIVGDTVNMNVTVDAGTKVIKDPYVMFSIDPAAILDFVADDALMWDGISWIANDPNDPFFFLENGSWIWDLGDKIYPGDEFLLVVPAVITDIGDIDMVADLYGVICCCQNNEPDPVLLASSENDNCCGDPYFLDSDTFSFESTDGAAGGGDDDGTDGDDGAAAGGDDTASDVSAASDTVPLQNTGAPLFLAVLAFLAILGGSVYGKLR
jgi:hypothetical protein